MIGRIMTSFMDTEFFYVFCYRYGEQNAWSTRCTVSLFSRKKYGFAPIHARETWSASIKGFHTNFFWLISIFFKVPNPSWHWPNNFKVD